MQRQAERFGTETLIDYVTEVDVNGPPFTVNTAGGQRLPGQITDHRGTGASPRRIGVPDEERLTGRGCQLLRHLRRLLLPRQRHRCGRRRR